MAAEEAEEESLQFGIGCIYFTARSGYDLSWQDAVKESLNSLTRVSEVEFDLGIVLAQEAQAGPGYYPTRGMLRFRLHIPLDEQKGLHELLRHITVATEDFIVMVFFRYFEPVAFILPQDFASKDNMDLVSSVIVVREYLHREFSTRELPAELHVIGPTPFHVAPCVKPGEIEKEFDLVRVPSRAYEEFDFLYSKEVFSSLAHAAVTLFDRVSDELSLFYSIVDIQARRQRQRNHITVLVQDLIDIYQAKGFVARMRRAFTSSAKIRSAALRAVSAEYQSQDDERSFRTKMDELYSLDVEPYFKEFLESEVSSRDTNQVLEAKEIVSLLDQARQRQIEVTSLFLSAVAGGLAGALVSLLIH